MGVPVPVDPGCGMINTQPQKHRDRGYCPPLSPYKEGFGGGGPVEFNSSSASHSIHGVNRGSGQPSLSLPPGLHDRSRT